MKPLVSIVIITYNQIKFIREALTGALEQDYKNLEVVVADDGSTDGTVEVILEYAEKYLHRLVPLVGGPHLGITGNSNRALKACKGKYIAFQGGDDVLLPGKITKQVEWIEQDENRVLCGHQVEVFYDDGSKRSHLLRKKLPSGHGPEWPIKNGCPFGATAVMVRSSVLPEYGFDERLPFASDGKLWIDILMDGGEYGYIGGVYARYRKHASSITATHSLEAVEDYRLMYQLLEQQHPDLRFACRLGRAKQVEYSFGRVKLFNNLFIEAAKHFWRAIMLDPVFYPKSYVRLIESILYELRDRFRNFRNSD